MSHPLIKNIPENSGIYLFKDSKGGILYIGKAKSLKARVKSYFQQSSNKGARIMIMISQIADIDFILTSTEEEALILESNFIKKYKPKYNIILRDDKQYPYLRLSIHDPFPNLQVTRRVATDKALYFGPYTPAHSLREMLKQISKIFPLRKSRDSLDGTAKRRPCLNYQIGKCLAPCAGYVSREDYHAVVKEVILFLKGRNNDLLISLMKEMKQYADTLQFEKAARLRDQINSIRAVMKKQEIISTDKEEQDVISSFQQEEQLLIQLLFVRSGKLTGKREYTIKDSLGKQGLLISDFLKQYYGNGEYIPDEIIIQELPDDKKVVEQWLSSQKGSSVALTAPLRGRKRKLLLMATENAKNALLQKNLSLEEFPSHIEGFDISTISGTNAVGSLVLFRNGKPSKREYRHYRIKSGDTPDDYRMIKEVVRRRYTRQLKENNPLPDLILIDGGKGHLAAAKGVLRLLKIDHVDLVSIAKGKKRNKGETDTIFPSSSTVSKPLLQRIRDEAHRFAITFHRELRRKGISSEITQIEGIGNKLRVSLLKHFGSVAKIKKADIKELTKAPGINKGKAELIFNYFHSP